MEPIRILSEQLTNFAREIIALLPNFLAALLVLALTLLVARFAGLIARKVLTRSKARPSLLAAVASILRLLVWITGFLIAATVVFPNLTPTKLVAGLGIGSIAIGLAFKDIFENFLAGFLILLRKPMRIGDDIECEGLSGTVEEISIRDTFLRKRSGELVIVPNSHLFKNPVKILTDTELRRISLVVGVAYGEDAAAAKDVIESAIQKINSPDAEQPAQVFAVEFNSSSIDFLVRWWAKSAPPDEHVSRNAAVLAIKAALDDAGIEIPFPYRTLTFAEPLALQRDSAGETPPRKG
ncbi:small-conductance mechanosensitive channel [Aliiruegeria haliotis]|uniref:Small-conductance mechanosensitive channel n=1 Tax=Aliiruegeria haliotis TaxID=1280846 RepID=A0A2T0RM97_9RHOB|nr:mechanosensitive ion channel family protein [Aliiruegeria haliotis]PRY22257.1 small-conductance mechanosensitive channel [Aliiruegeria haliotis]